MKRFKMALGFVMGLALAASVGMAQSKEKVMVGGFDVGPGGAPGLFNPLTLTAGFSWVNKYFSSLILYDVSFQYLQGDLASSWVASSDGLKYTFKLRKNVTWHDGKPFTSKDVKFTLDTARNPEVASLFLAKLEAIRSVEAPDASTVIVNMSRPNAALLDALTNLMMLPEHQLSAIPPKDLSKSTWWSTSPVGTGPFKWSKYVPDQYVELVAFDNYWRGRPKLDRLVNRYFKEAGSAVLALRSGDIQFTYVSLDEARGLSGVSNLRTIEGPSQVLNYFGFNNKDPRFKDVRVKQAFLHAIDRATIIKQLFGGAASPASCVYTSAKYVPTTGMTDYNYSPEKAKQLLAAAGWDKIKGDPIEMLYYYNDQLSADVMVAVQQMLAAVGIDARPRKVDVPTFNQITAGENFVMAYAGAGNGPEPDILIVNLDSNSVPPKGNNRFRVNVPGLDNLFVKGQTTTSSTARAKVYQDICQLTNEYLPWGSLWIAKRFGSVSRNVQNFVWTPAPGGGRYYDQAEKWDIK